MTDKNKLFESFLAEDNSNATISSAGNSSEGLNPSEESFIITGMNDALAGICNFPTINPYYIVERVRERVKSFFGLTFEDLNFNSEPVGTIEKPLVPLYNNITGIRNQANQHTVDNGYLKLMDGNNLAIRFHYVKVKNIYTVSVQIVNIPKPSYSMPV